MVSKEVEWFLRINSLLLSVFRSNQIPYFSSNHLYNSPNNNKFIDEMSPL